MIEKSDIKSIVIKYDFNQKAFKCCVNRVQFFALDINDFEKKVEEIIEKKKQNKNKDKLFKIDPRPVISHCIKTGKESYFENRQAAIKTLGIYTGRVGFCLNGTQSSTQGFKFRFATEEDTKKWQKKQKKKI